MNVKIAIERKLLVPAPRSAFLPLLEDLEGTVGRFPKLKKLTKLAPDEYLWEMRTIGSRIANIAHDVSYAAHYRVDRKSGSMSWTPLPEPGNASIEGQFHFVERGEATELHFRVRGELREVPVPLMYRLVAPAFIQGVFQGLVETFLARTGEAVLEAQARAPGKAQAPAAKRARA